MIIRVCEDDDGLRAKWVASIGAAIAGHAKWTVEPLNDAREEIHELLARQAAHSGDVARANGKSVFDETDVLVVDYDLTMIDAHNARHTGEEVARLARLYSKVGYVIVTNQGDRTFDFDLSLKGRLRSYGDLNIPADTLRVPGLWLTAITGDFDPWGWDEIAAAIQARSELHAQLAAGDTVRSSVLDFLGVPHAAVEAFDDDVYEFLYPEAEDGAQLRQKCTFEEVLRAATEGKSLEKLLRDDRQQACSVAVARVAKCLSHLLLGPQNVLVDVPHLLQRFPFLMSPDHGNPSDPDAWERAVDAGDAALEPEIVRECGFSAANLWVGRSALWWPLVERHAMIAEKRAAFDPSKAADVVFAEDLSTFIPFEEAKEFRAAFHNRFDRRYIKLLDGYKYGPSRRLAFG